MKNTVYIKAKEHPVTPPELFASYLGTHFVEKYSHITAAHIKVVTHRWTRMTIDGKPHPHSFYRDGSETRNVEAVVRKGKGIEIRSGIVGLLVLKSTGSQFHGFVRDEYTTLPEVWDRILSTDVDCGWSWKTFPTMGAVEQATPKFNKAWEDARAITMKTFAEEDSPSVQNTMYKMCGYILDAVPEVENVDYSLPNKHYFEIGKFTIAHLSRNNLLTCFSRHELAQGYQEHRQGRRGLRPSIWTQRSHRSDRCTISSISKAIDYKLFVQVHSGI
jgi:urate oxidase